MSGRTAQRVWLALGGLVVALLAAAVFTLGSLNLPVSPQGRSLAVLFALSTFIVAALLVFGLVLARSLLRLWTESRARQLGSRFKTRMVLGAMGISLLPVIFLFFVSYALMNRTLSKWFPRPLEIATEQSRQLIDQQAVMACRELDRLAAWAAKGATAQEQLERATSAGADVAWLARDGRPQATLWRGQGSGTPPQPDKVLPGGAELWQAGDRLYFVGRAPAPSALLVVARRAPESFATRLAQIDAYTTAYWQEQQSLRAYKKQILLALLLFTVLVLFSVTWVALFLSKTVTVPIQALAVATGEISRGNFDHRISAHAQDELGALVGSFNQMAAQLGESRRQIDASTRHLERALEEIERRRDLMTTLLENVPTGVLLLDANGRIAQSNSAVGRIFGPGARAAQNLADLLGEEAARRVNRLAHRSRRIGAVSEELELGAGGRLLHAAVTVSALGPPRSERGVIVVIDDLTELLRAQKAAAWQEVAQRIAHEIKNPLTPIRLSAERLLRQVRRSEAAGDASALGSLAAECAGLIGHEVETLKSLVDEFSQFARFPAARLEPADLNDIARGALDVFQGRLDGIALRAQLSGERPLVNADGELLRRVVVNLIENAAEAMEGSPLRELSVETRFDADADTAELVVADTGHGISPEDKDRLFLPHFSTRNRGTGLGLAIASRIVAEHHGTIRVEDNQPAGTRFVIRLPVASVPSEESGP
ncbi:MAG TPA: ATP-binding protein [Candidatus Acidoferrales bacterium]|nr:ATP-binding protein [Candidatus Acidoferrales bacterium]